jgi:hypothetical protein
MSARGRPAAKDFSRLIMASNCAGQWRKLAQAFRELLFLLHPGEQGFGAMERKGVAGVLIGKAEILKAETLKWGHSTTARDLRFTNDDLRFSLSSY